MPITPAQSGRKKISLNLLLAQLDQDWDESQRADAPFTSDDEKAMAAFYQVAARAALEWVQGDYHYQFPAWYAGQRLARVCAYLKAQEGRTANTNALLDERDKQITLLRETTWPHYRDRCTAGHGYHASTGDGGSVTAELTYTWDGLDSLYTPETDDGPLDKPLSYLPRFHAPESEAWHCNCLAVLFLNRAAKYRLTDLEVTPF